MSGPVTSMENFLLQAGPAPAIGIWMLDRPGDAERHLAEIAHAVGRSQTFSRALRKTLTWHFWARDKAQPVIAEHVICLEDHAIRSLDDLSAIAAKTARLGFDPERPRWRAILLNPEMNCDGARAPRPNEQGRPLNAFILHFDHAIADGIRVERFVRDMASLPAKRIMAAAPEKGVMNAPCLDRQAFDNLPEHAPGHLIRPAFVSIAKSRIRANRPEGVSTTSFVIDAFAELLDRQAFYDDTDNRTHRAIVTSGLSTARDAREGNYFMAFECDALPARLRGRGLRPTTGRTSTWRQTLASPLPSAILKWLIRFWYRQFDVMLNVIPGATRPFELGKAKVTGGYGLPPVLTDMALTADMIGALGSYHFTLMPGERCKVSPQILCRELEKSLTGREPPEATDVTTRIDNRAAHKAVASARISAS